MNRNLILPVAFALAFCTATVNAQEPPKSVLVIGDSVSIGWSIQLWKQTRGTDLAIEHAANAIPLGPDPQNNGQSGAIVANLPYWFGAGQHYDAIVFNAGIHDAAL